MIERPKRAVTRFFIPLIDVLILLFCIFLLMPYMNQSENSPPSVKAVEPKKLTPDQLRTEVASLRIDLERSQRDLTKLREGQADPGDRFRVFVLDIDPKDGSLFYYRDGRPTVVKDERAAQELIDEHKRHTGIGREALFVILLPRVDSLFPDRQQLNRYHDWFRQVAHRFDSPYGTLPPELEEKR